jgi:hypothetical protein
LYAQLSKTKAFLLLLLVFFSFRSSCPEDPNKEVKVSHLMPEGVGEDKAQSRQRNMNFRSSLFCNIQSEAQQEKMHKE